MSIKKVTSTNNSCLAKGAMAAMYNVAWTPLLWNGDFFKNKSIYDLVKWWHISNSKCARNMGSLRIICFSAMWVDCALTRSPEQLKIGISTYFDIQYKHERDSSWAKNSYETAKKLSSLSRGLENHPTPIKYSFISLKVQGDIPFHFFTKRKGGTTHIYWRQTGFLSYSE